ncbi:MAG TPA: GYD domain-containing protein [Dehalococcoidia bacterium]
MPTFIMLTRLSPEAVKDPRSFEELNNQVEQQIRSQAPGVKWTGNYAVLGPYDYLDIFEAPDEDTAIRVSTIIRAFGHATTETWLATPWARFVGMTRDIASQAARS